MLTYTLIPWADDLGSGYKITRQSTYDDAPLYLFPTQRGYVESSFDPAFGFVWGSEPEAITFILYVEVPQSPHQIIVKSYEGNTCGAQRAEE